MLVLDPLTPGESSLCWDQQWINKRPAAISVFLLAKGGGRIMPGERSSRVTILLLSGADSDEKTCKAAACFTALAKVEADFFHFLALHNHSIKLIIHPSMPQMTEEAFETWLNKCFQHAVNSRHTRTPLSIREIVRVRISRWSRGQCAACQQELAGDWSVLCPRIFNSLLPAPSLSCCFLREGFRPSQECKGQLISQQEVGNMLTARWGSKHRVGKEICLLQIIVNRGRGRNSHKSGTRRGEKSCWIIIYKAPLKQDRYLQGEKDCRGWNNKKRIYFCRFGNPGRTIISTMRLFKLPLTEKIIHSGTMILPKYVFALEPNPERSEASTQANIPP